MVPANVVLVASRDDGAGVRAAAREEAADGGGNAAAAELLREDPGCRRTEMGRMGCRALKVTASLDTANPGCTMRTAYGPRESLSSVSGVRPRHCPFTMTPARLGVEITMSRPVSTL